MQTLVITLTAEKGARLVANGADRCAPAEQDMHTPSVTSDQVRVEAGPDDLTALLSSLPVSALASGCMHEIESYRPGEARTNPYSVELLRRATVGYDPLAWEALQQCLSAIAMCWLRRHPLREQASRFERDEHYVAQAFARLWLAQAHQQRLEFRSLAAALSYLRASLNGVILDTLRCYQRSNEQPLPEPGWLGEPLVADEEEGGELWESIQHLLPTVRERQASGKPADPAMLLYTSGTTGFPKGALLSHRAVINNMMLIMRRIGNAVEPGDRYCLPMPFFHITGAGIVVYIIVAKMVLHPLIAFAPLKMLHIMHQEGCHVSFAVPTMLLALLQHPEFETYRPTSLKIVASGAAPVPVALMEQVKERMGSDIVIVFGQTEATGVITQTKPEDTFERKAATVGLPLTHVDVKIIDPATGDIVPVGERGELCCRGYLVMVGYYNMPEKTAAPIDGDGWLHTGDLATMDAQGYVNIVGRLKDMVIRGGENLFPAEIEAFLIRHPKVADVQVLGVPDTFFGEELLAVVIPKAGEQLTEQELRDYCTGQISHQKIPRYVQFVESYPLTASGKVQKFVLRERAIKALGLEEVANVRTA